MRFKKKSNSIVKSIDSGAGGLAPDDSLKGHNLVFRVVLSAALIFGITFLYPIDKVYMPIDVPSAGELATKDIVAPFDFPILKTDEELKRDRDLIISSLRPVVTEDTIMSMAVSEGARLFFDRIDSLAGINRDSSLFMESAKSEYPAFPESVLVVFLNSREARSLRRFCLPVIDSMIARGIISRLDNLPYAESGLVLLKHGDTTRTVPRETLLDVKMVEGLLSLRAQAEFGDSPALKKAAVSIAGYFLKPNMEYDREATENNRRAELQGVKKEKGQVNQMSQVDGLRGGL